MYNKVEIKDNSFTIYEVTKKPQRHDLAEETLKKFKQILISDMNATAESPYAKFDKSERICKIKKLSADIAEKYTNKCGKEWLICRWIRKILPFKTTREKVEDLAQFISNFNPKQFFSLEIPLEISQRIFDYLSLNELRTVTLLSKDARTIADLGFIKRARDLGYTGKNDADETKEYLKNLLSTTRDFDRCKYYNELSYIRGYTEMVYRIPFLRLKELVYSPEKTLYKLRACSTSDILRLPTHILQNRILSMFLLHFTYLNKISIQPNCELVAKYGGTFHLNYAVQRGNKPFIELLLAHGIRSNSPHELLSLVANSGNLEILELLLEKGGLDKDLRDPNCGKTALHEAVRGGHVDIVKALLNHGANPNISTNLGSLPLHWAAIGNRIEAVKCLLLHGVNVDWQDNEGETALYMAARKGHVDLVRTLLNHRANPNISTNQGSLPLHMAVQTENEDIVRNLLDHEANPNQPTIEGTLPLHLAVQNGSIGIVRCLLDHGVNIDLPYKDREDVIAVATKNAVVNARYYPGSEFFL